MTIDAPPFLEAIHDALAGAPIERARARWATAAAPWHAWLLVVLARQISAQRWALRVWRGPLHGAEGDTEGYPEVPGMAGWRYHIQGIRLTLLGPENEHVEVDDHGDEGVTIHANSFGLRLQSLPDPPLPEQRLFDFLPDDPLTGEDILYDAVEQLAAIGLIQLGEHERTFRIPPALEAAAEALAKVAFSSRKVAVRWAEHMGDHLFLDDARAPAQRLAHKRYLLAGLDRMPRGFLGPLEVQLSPAEFVEACVRVIEGRVGSPVGHAIKRLEAHPDYPVCLAVARFLQRADPAKDHPYAVVMAAHYLLRRGLDRPLALRAVVAFAQVEVVDGYDDNPQLGKLALLLLEHVPSQALAAIRRSLRQLDTGDQRTIATALAVLDQPWCHRELFRALNEATVFEGTAALRAALRHCSAPRGSEVVARWEQTHAQLHPPSGEVPARTWGELLEVRARQILEDEAKDLRPWVEAIRPTIDPDFDRIAWA